MAKKKNTFGKFLAFTTAVAAIGGTCYIFRDKIKQSSLYKASASKLADIYDKVSDKFCDQKEDEFFFDDEDEDFEEVFSEEAKKGREYTSITINTKEEPDASDNTPESPAEQDIPVSEDFEETSANTETVPDFEQPEAAAVSDRKEVFSEETIPTISFGSSSQAAEDSSPDSASDKEDAEEITGYENEGLSDVSEDPDVLEEQDTLDF